MCRPETSGSKHVVPVVPTCHRKPWIWWITGSRPIWCIQRNEEDRFLIGFQLLAKGPYWPQRKAPLLSGKTPGSRSPPFCRVDVPTDKSDKRDGLIPLTIVNCRSEILWCINHLLGPTSESFHHLPIGSSGAPLSHSWCNSWYNLPCLSWQQLL